MIRTITVGSVVQHVDGKRMIGEVIKLIGHHGTGDGVHARIVWSNGGSSVTRLDLLRKV